MTTHSLLSTVDFCWGVVVEVKVVYPSRVTFHEFLPTLRGTGGGMRFATVNVTDPRR